MILTRSEAFSFLNKLATDSKPLLGLSLSASGFSLFAGSIVDLKPDYFIVNQGNGTGLALLCVPMDGEVLYQYGDVRELMDRIPSETRANDEVKAQLDHLKSLIEGGLALEFGTAVLILIEFNDTA